MHALYNSRFWSKAMPEQTVYQMQEAQPRMFQNHPRPSVTHNRLYLFSTVSLITMDRAFRAGWLFLPKSATVQAQPDIPLQLPAFTAQRSTVKVPAINLQHRIHRFPLTSEARVCEGCDGHRVNHRWGSVHFFLVLDPAYTLSGT